MMSDDAPLLRVSGLRVDLATAHHSVNVVTDVSIHVRAGETLALVGESGCGKSLTALAIMRLLSAPLAMSGGTIEFSGQRLDQLEEEACRRIRGAAMSMVFQEPMTALNPVYRVGEQIAEVVQVHQNVSRVEAVTRAVDSLATVGIADAAERARLYPHELSGGMKQRVMIAMALVCDPILLIADEPTTALDVTIQAQILALLRSARQRRGLGLLLITHDLGVVAQHADRVAIMYAGCIVEEAPVLDLFALPRHPYTRALLASLPGVVSGGAGARAPLASIEGSVPTPHEFSAGCRFANRCGYADAQCESVIPAIEWVSRGHTVACHHHEKLT